MHIVYVFNLYTTGPAFPLPEVCARWFLRGRPTWGLSGCRDMVATEREYAQYGEV
jgi:hypothetical protein